MNKANLRLAAIDIGSNAIRMAIAEHSVRGMSFFKKFRFPIRLGADVFATGMIGGHNLKESARTFKKFNQLMRKYQVQGVRAVGTSALREARNKEAFVELIHRKSSIRIDVIDGIEEAKLIHLAVRREIQLDAHRALLIDIGGGSVELTFSDQGRLMATDSFPFGTVRTLELMKKRKLTESELPLILGDYLQPLARFLHSHAGTAKLDFGVGTGGNLETLGKLKPVLLNQSSKTWLSFEELTEIIKRLQKMSVKMRIDQLGLRPDRADVIVPAALLVQTVMRQAQVSKIMVPHVGLKDGLLWSMVHEMAYSENSLG